MSESLSLKERIEFSKVANKARADPIYFIKDILGWKSIWPKQEEIIRTFYQHKYDPSLQEYKELAWVSGQRCQSRNTLILTREYGNIKIEDLFNKFHEGNVIHVKNRNGWVKVGNAFYVGFKAQYRLLLSCGKRICCSLDHKFLVNDKWTPLKDIKSSDKIVCYDESKQEFFNSTVVGWDQEEFTIEMYDLHVPDGNSYIADGILSHNSGKTATVAHLCAFEFFELVSLDNPSIQYGLLPNQPLAVNCIAAGKEQALDGVFSLMRNALENSDWMNRWFKLKYSEGRVDCFEKHAFAQVKAARADTGAGYTSALVAFDELDLFNKTTESKASAENVFRKLVNSTMTLGNRGKVVSISSLDNTDGMMSKVYYDASLKKNALTYNLCTWEVNPSPEVSEAHLLEEYKYNMEAFWKYFANQPGVVSKLLFPEGSVRLDRNQYNIFELGYVPEQSQNKIHVMSCDPAFRNDSFGIACGYREGDHIVIDGAWRFRKISGKESYVRPSDIENFIFDWIGPLNVETFVFDVDLILSTVEKLEDNGINCIKHLADSEAYSKWVNLNSGIGELGLTVTYDEHLKRECDQLYKKALPSGKMRVDHPENNNGSKDIADCVANCIWYLSNNETGNTWRPVGNFIRI